MKAISLWQPWASAIAAGSKTVETRSWATNYRGPLAIHAAKRCVIDEMIYLGACYNWCAALRPVGGDVMGKNLTLDKVLPFGAIVATCTLLDCRPTDSFTLAELRTKRFQEGQQNREHTAYFWTEESMGDFGLGRFGWVLGDIRRLATPVPWTGRQGFFEVPDDVIQAALV